MTPAGSLSADRGSMHDALVRLFVARFGHAPRSVLEIAGDGSNRSYFRLIGGELETAVGAYGPDPEENHAFFSFTNAFRRGGLPVPELYGVDASSCVWLEEDLGDTTLFNALVEARRRDGGEFPESMLPVYRRVVEWLPRFQVEGAKLIDFNDAYPRAAFDRQSIIWDLNYFKYHFLKLAQIPFNEERLERDFHHLADFLLQADTSLFLYRDFQSRNIMLDDAGNPHFIDYQGGRRGAPQYDIASLLFDAKAAIPFAVRDELLQHYLDALSQHMPVDRERFVQLYRGYVIVRIMQAMGAYGYRGFFERKARFLQSVPYAARNLQFILGRGLPIELPELRAAFARIAEGWAEQATTADSPGLRVYVNSFSFRRGYPEDQGGHGGGYVFDCRALPNPGRHLEYCDQCGRDTPVVDYLERRAETHEFWGHVEALIDSQVGEYLRRDFSSLTVSFGCTGGQHRSVYFAERLAARAAAGADSDIAGPLRGRLGGSSRVLMDAMILAAGIGSRLGEITRRTPKALVPVAGVPVLERIAQRLILAGADRVIINVHHQAAQIVEYVERRHGFGVEVVFSHEVEAPLETGGGLLKAAPLFRRNAPFFLHNVDVLSDLDLEALYAHHVADTALATLAVSERRSSRLLLFSDDCLCGHLDRRGIARADLFAPFGDTVRPIAFAGVHVISPALLGLITERGTFSILDVYLRLAGMGHDIRPYDIADASWLEIGSPERLAAAEAYFTEQEAAAQ